ncbi:MAG: M23 family peptidase [Bifidobacterium sp.]|nr:M23 family peptidase [Bifidobacterium sp.]MCI1864489.1 M23 family peptidase [Bifidobacterium sp.]
MTMRTTELERANERRKRRQWWNGRRDRASTRTRIVFAACLLAACLSTAFVGASWDSGTALASQDTGDPTSDTSSAGCAAQFSLPLRDAIVVRPFDAPAEQWSPGHRGVDVSTPEGNVIGGPGISATPLLAPAEGIIAFRGMVANKSIVTIRHGSLTSTFEPAQSALPVGSHIVQGDVFAVAQGFSDHCGGRCVHWGVKDAEGKYTDPLTLIEQRKIMIKP